MPWHLGNVNASSVDILELLSFPMFNEDQGALFVRIQKRKSQQKSQTKRPKGL
jgi:hypothetical protein